MGGAAPGDKDRRAAPRAHPLHADQDCVGSEGLAEDGDPVPDPSSLEAVMADPKNRSAEAIIVAVKMGTPRSVRVNVTFQEISWPRSAERHDMPPSGSAMIRDRHLQSLLSGICPRTKEKGRLPGCPGQAACGCGNSASLCA